MDAKKKRLVIVLLTMIAFSGIVEASPITPSPPGHVTIDRNVNIHSFSLPGGTLVQTQNSIANRAFGTATNNTFRFDVSGQELSEPQTSLNFLATTTSNITVIVSGIQPKLVICPMCSSSTYFVNREIIALPSGVSSSTLIIMWSIFPLEAKRVLFIDDFLGSSPLLDSSWTIDLYNNNPQNTPGEFTTGGYASFTAQSTSNIEGVHVTLPILGLNCGPACGSGYQTGQSIKRKMTVSLYPFTGKESNTATLHIGFAPLYSSGSYPGNTPQNTPQLDYQSNCSGIIGSEYVSIDNSGNVYGVSCGNGSSNRTLIESIDPTLYTVLTIEPFSIVCSTCTDNALSSWVWFRIYQEDSVGTVIAGSDTNINITSSVSPLRSNSYIFLSQLNSNTAVTRQTSWIDFVQVQNYGSPVCLFGCIPPLDIPSDPFSSLWATLVAFCQWIGLGDLGFGAFILFALLQSIVLTSTYVVMNRYEGASTLVMAIEFMAISGIFLTSGLMGSIWLFAILTVDAMVALVTFRALFFSGSRGNSGVEA